MAFQGSHEWTKDLSCPVMDKLTNIMPNFLSQEFPKFFWTRNRETTKVLGFCLALNSATIFYLELLISASSEPPLLLKEKITSKIKPPKKIQLLENVFSCSFPYLCCISVTIPVLSDYRHWLFFPIAILKKLPNFPKYYCNSWSTCSSVSELACNWYQ